jgi:ribosome-binding factor A
MPEQRARTYHRGRVASTFAEEITAMLEGELSDPRIAPCYVTEVVLAPGGKSCRVFIAVTGSAAEEDDTLAGLMAARAYIRTEIRDRMGVRHVPELTFAIDRSEKMGARMDELLGRMEKHRGKMARRNVSAATPEQHQVHATKDVVTGAKDPEHATPQSTGSGAKH